MTKTLTPQEALRALADGKTLQIAGRKTTFIVSNHVLHVRYEDRSERSVMYLDKLCIAEEANPHPVGTWLWAGFEYALGKSVRRAGAAYSYAGKDWSCRTFHGADVTATDWEVVE